MLFIHDVISKILTFDSNYIVDMVMRPKFGGSSITMRKVIRNSFLSRCDQKNQFFFEC